MMLLHLILTSLISLLFAGSVKLGLWVYEVKTNHLPHLQAVAEETRDAVKELPAVIDAQTTAIVAELREQRQDIRHIRPIA